MRMSISHGVPDASRIFSPVAFAGFVDCFGYSSAAGGWLFNGWVTRPSDLHSSEAVDFVAQYEKSQCSGSALLAFYQRADLDENSIGVIAFFTGGSPPVGALQHIDFVLRGNEYRALAGDFTTRLLDQDIVDRVRLSLTTQTIAGPQRDHILGITARAGFTGHDTLSSLSETVLLEIDDAIACPPGGVLLKGWLLAAPGVICGMQVRSGPIAAALSLSDALRVDRPDVIAAIGASHGFSENRCGFIAHVPAVLSAGDVTYIQVELENGEVGFKKLTLAKRVGLDAIRHVLEGVDIRQGEIDAAFDRTLGPAVASIHSITEAVRRRHPMPVTELKFGRTPKRPLCSVVIPLYGRVDFVEYQMALFSRSWDGTELELVYVLDDPTKRRELENLARSLHERFSIPFRLLMLESNVGFAAASNVGLHAACGRYVCFLNSDVFPITDRWLTRLIQGLEANSDVGILGSRLLYEDGSVQHEGCFYKNLSEFGQWTFVEHLNKGRRPGPGIGIRRCDAITGACMVLESALAKELGGFDESFIIGDFEDSDLCLKAKARGLASAVDMGVEMYHLERKSQVSPGASWRMNLTLYNAWVHQRRWFDASAPHPTPSLESI
jgi:GT2 family glycosyltransferase